MNNNISQKIESTKPIISISNKTLQDDVYLEDDIIPQKGVVSPNTFENIFITGATGFIGTHITHTLLNSTNAHITVLIRAQNTNQALQKLQHSFENYGLWNDSFISRITPIIGDLRKAQLGMTDDTYLQLASTLDHIYHCGALVNFILPYYLLKNSNVSGLKHILKLSCAKRNIPISYLSTYSVLFSNDLNSTMTESYLTHSGESLKLGYSQSKWVAEKIAQLAQERNIPITTYRLGSITGDSESGLFNRKDFLTNFIDYCLKIERMPTFSGLIDMTPVNYAATAIIELSKQNTKKPIYHVLNPNPASWNQLVTMLQKIKPNLQTCSEIKWKEFALKYGKIDHPFKPYFPLLKQESFKISDICLSENQKCSTTNTENALSHMFCPSINKELLNTYLKGIAYTAPKKHLYAVPSLSTIGTITSIVKAKKPIFLQSFMHKPTAKAAHLLSEFISKKTTEEKLFKTFFANSQLEAFDGIVKLLRHNGNKVKKGAYFSLAIFDPDQSLKKKLAPQISSKIDLRPNLEWMTNKEAILNALYDPTTFAIIIVISPILSAYDLIEYAKIADKTKTKLIFDISRTELTAIPTLPRKTDGIIFGSNLTEYQFPIGGFSVTDNLYKVWNTIDNCLLHTSTFGGNTVATTLMCKTLFNTLNIPQSEQHIESLSDKEVTKLYKNYINPKLVLLLQSMGMTKSVHYAFESTLKWTYKGKTQTVIDGLGSFASSLRGHNPNDVLPLLQNLDLQQDHWKSLKQTLCRLSGCDDAIPAISGASAVEIALTLALMANPEKPYILTFKNGFSGKTLVSMIGTTKEKYLAPFAPLYPKTICIDPSAPDVVNQFKEVLSKYPIGLVWFEIIQGEAGVKPLPQALLTTIQEQKTAHQYLIGIDEIQTGLFRTGKFLNYEEKIEKPDFLTIGKGLSDMICPIAAVLCSNAVLEKAEKTNESYTSGIYEFYANSISSAISNKALQSAQTNNLSKRANQLGNKLKKELKKLEGKGLIKEVRGEGLLLGIELKKTILFTLPFIKDYVAAIFAGCCLNQKTPVLVAFTLNNPNTVRLAPSLTISEEEIDQIIANITKISYYSPLKLLIKSMV